MTATEAGAAPACTATCCTPALANAEATVSADAEDRAAARAEVAALAPPWVAVGSMATVICTAAVSVGGAGMETCTERPIVAASEALIALVEDATDRLSPAPAEAMASASTRPEMVTATWPELACRLRRPDAGGIAGAASTLTDAAGRERSAARADAAAKRVDAEMTAKVGMLLSASIADKVDDTIFCETMTIGAAEPEEPPGMDAETRLEAAKCKARVENWSAETLDKPKTEVTDANVGGGIGDGGGLGEAGG